MHVSTRLPESEKVALLGSGGVACGELHCSEIELDIENLVVLWRQCYKGEMQLGSPKKSGC